MAADEGGSTLISRLRRSALARRVAPVLPDSVRELGKDVLVRHPRPRWGNLRRARPFSELAGFDRGTPVDRFYIERFLARHARDVRGRVLEVRDARYTTRFGGDGVTDTTILDVDAANPSASLVADLGERGSLPRDAYDCIVLTHVLQYVADVDAALANVANALAPSGVALVAVPTIAGLDVRSGADDLWRWTPTGFARVLARACPELRAEVHGDGSLVGVIAFFHGIAAEELTEADLDGGDRRFTLVTCARLAAGGA